MRKTIVGFGFAVLFYSGLAVAETSVTLYKSPTCGCCENYVQYLKKNGFLVDAVNQADMGSVKQRFGVPPRMASCHTAIIGGYVIEGHVPVAAINKLLRKKPSIVGISVPEMPPNSPGMGEMVKGSLTVYTIPKDNSAAKVFSVE